jgi:hypothetical protein
MNIKFWRTKNVNILKRVLDAQNMLEWLLDAPLKGRITTADFNRQKLNDEDLVIYEIRSGLKLAGLVFFKIKDRSAKIDVAFLPWARGKTARQVIEPLLKYEHEVHHIREFYGRIKEGHKASLKFAEWAKFEQVHNNNGIITVRRYYNG